MQITNRTPIAVKDRQAKLSRFAKLKIAHED